MDVTNVAKRLQIGSQKSWHKTREVAQRLGRTGKMIEDIAHFCIPSLLMDSFLGDTRDSFQFHMP